jgi:WD40 repeat protein
MAFSAIDPSSPPTAIETRRFRSDGRPVWDVAFSPDGATLLIAGEDQQAHVWTIDPAGLVKAICTRLRRDLTDRERADLDLPGADETCVGT